MKKRKILFIHPGMSTFVKADFEFINHKYETKEFFYKASKTLKGNLTEQFRMLFWLVRYIWWCDSIYIWFADYHSFLPTIFGRIILRPVYSVLGGSDTQYIKKYNYGNIYGPYGIRKWCVIFSLKYATCLFPVDECLIYSTNNFIEGEYYEYGAKKIVKNFNTPYKVQVTSINESIWNVKTKKNIVITVAKVDKIRTLKRKGIEFYLQVAKEMPEVDFILVGISKSIISQLSIPKNVTSFPFVEWDTLKEIYATSKVFCLFTFAEGVPNVLLEAMASGCVPLVSNVSGNPGAIYKYGYLLKRKRVDDAVKLCKMALQSNDLEALEISKYAKSRFKLENRKSFLLDVFNGNYK
jgi:glycosyltransferase involved in cell wall biosynthesis